MDAVAPELPTFPLSPPQSPWLRRILSWDVLMVGLGVHGLSLLVMGTVQRPTWVATMVALFVVWRVAFMVAERRSSPGRALHLELLNGLGSVVLSAALLLVDGGTESPLFFWIVIIIAWHAIVHSAADFTRLAMVALGAYVVVVVVATDITPASLGRFGLLFLFCFVLQVGRLRLQVERATAEELTRLIADIGRTAPVGLIMFGDDPARFLYANQAAQDLRLTEAERHHLTALAAKARDGSLPPRPELLTLARPGRVHRHLRVVAAPHRATSGILVVVAAEDVTAQVTMGEERRRFLQMASHQLRTPLTPIIAYAEMLAREDLAAEETVEASEAILLSARRLDRLFTRMSTLVALEHSPTRSTRPVAISEVLRHVAAVDRDLLDAVRLRGDTEQVLECDPASVAVVLFELLDNGRRYGRPPIELSWHRDDATVTVEVTDAGPGPVHADDMFGLWREHLGPDVVPGDMGTALGLPHARLLTSVTGGDLSFERHPGRWAFVLRFPDGHARITRTTDDRSPVLEHAG